MNKPNCRFCKSEPSKQSIKGDFVFGGKPEQKFWLCDDCQTIYLYPPPSEEDEIAFYKQEFEKFMGDRSAPDKDWSSPEKHFQSNQDEMKRRMCILEKYVSKGQKILEVGCSSGFMLNALKERGTVVYGIDPSEGFIEYVKAKDILVYKNLFELKKDFNGKFDIIIHYYVLEHIREPLEFIQSYMNLLNENGRMIFEVPCATDPLVELYKVPAFEKFYWSVAHHWYYNKESLTALLGKTGLKFQLFPEQRYDLSNHIIWMLEGKPGGLGRFTNIFGHGFDELYKEQLKKSWYCDTLIAILDKN